MGLGPKLDRIDLKILAKLQHSGRITNVELADAVGLSPSPCLTRVKRLETAGYITGYGAQLNLRKLGEFLTIFTEVTLTEHRQGELPGTIHTAAAQIEQAGGQALPIVVDVRDEASVQTAVDAAVARFGGIDICVNNASAISLTGTLETDMKRYDLMHQINARGTFLVTRACLPHLRKAVNPHVLALSPPLDFRPHWFAAHPAYTVAKYNMSLYMMAMAAEFRGEGVAFNALWPRTMIATSAVKFALNGDAGMQRSRTPEIMADAAHAIFSRAARSCTGRFFLDDEVLWEEGVADFAGYAAGTGSLAIDLFVDPAAGVPPGVEVS